MNKPLIVQFTPLVLMVLLAGGSLAIAIVDPSFRPLFADLAKVGLGGYLGQLIPQMQRQKADDEFGHK
ncbi:MAG: hypothetical protein NW237_03880 [Cyanobacteriota bacterium]|nr:hypothetical protein [Cyanobacteriota bacterium]